ncbi:MAG: D-alanyl-D-alanine carboxypeptidase/D-alanyl-D-alanine-endopeptidase [Acidobacteria bacterium]|nr:D-alanyl-D-alanine carboxypeptidase/D-alanyl-D-alanine-endopeptidase [Acidobacteriota bacterium]
MLRAAFLLAGLLALAPLSAQPLAERIEKLISTPAAAGSTFGIQVVQLSTGQVLYARNAQSALTPASNTKLFTTALALTRLGPGYRFETKVLAPRAPDAQGRISGDLILLGGGDPTLSARRLPYQKGPVEGDPLAPLAELADQLAAAGLRTVSGDLIGDDTRWPFEPFPGGWSVGDMPWDYGAAVSALCLNDNAQSISVRPGKAAGDPAIISLSPPVEYYTLRNVFRTTPGAASRLSVRRKPASRILEIAGTAAPKAGALGDLLGIDDPAAFIAEAFAQLLRDRGIAIQGRVYARHRATGMPSSEPAGIVLARRQSPPIVETLRVIDKISQNLHAEMALREVGFVARGEGTAEAAQKEMTAWLTSLGVRKEEFDLEDGSGLSRRTLVTPNAVTTLLTAMHNGEHRETYRSLLPIGGEDGSLSSRFKGAPQANLIRAKTGSVAHVNALSGYAGDDPSSRLAFSIIVNGSTASSSAIRSIIDKIAVAILEEGTRQ